MPYVYHIAWIASDIHYYGIRLRHQCNPKDDLWIHYFTSSKYVRKHRQEFGEPDVVEIRRVFQDDVSARNWEMGVLRRLKVRTNQKWLNRYDGKFRGSTKPKSEETRQKILIGLIGKTKSASHREALSKSITGSFTWVTNGLLNYQVKLNDLDDFIHHNPEYHVGFKTSLEAREKLSNIRRHMISIGTFIMPDNTGKKSWNSGKNKHNDVRVAEIGVKISLANKGKPNPKVSGKLNGMYGRKPSPESIDKASKRTKRMRWYNNSVSNLYLDISSTVPDGFVPGRITGWNTHPSRTATCG